MVTSSEVLLSINLKDVTLLQENYKTGRERLLAFVFTEELILLGCCIKLPCQPHTKSSHMSLVGLSAQASWLSSGFVAGVTHPLSSVDEGKTTGLLIVLQCLPTIHPEGQTNSPTVHWERIIEQLSYLQHKEPGDMPPEILVTPLSEHQ